ncbi:hypothetical protein ACJMK2_041926 [Sinanodonta woodiana]|uniref:Kyphoscoliosis peptidase n=1 Tax=Sinanodonta woodiana TaxID=1069815 RepID=A0ABD3W5R2_SINWO
MGSGPSTPPQKQQTRPSSAPNGGKVYINGATVNGHQATRPKTGESGGGIGGGTGAPPIYNRNQIPPPAPPKFLKRDIFAEKDFADVEDYIARAPPKLLVGNFKDLVNYLTKNKNPQDIRNKTHGDWDDLKIVRAIFLWITSVDVYNLKVDGVPPTHSPLEYFTKIQMNMGNHAHLISGLCQMAGIPCVIISGMNKSAAYEIGTKCDRKSMGAQWNAVYVRDDWRFLDAFWASACVVGRKSGEWTLVDSDGNMTQEEEGTSEGTTQHRINEFYFFPDPDKLVWTHLPDEPQWQLLETPITQTQYEEHVYIRERFHILNMKFTPNSHEKCLLDAAEGEIQIEFSLPINKSEFYRFKYMLYQSRSGKGDDVNPEVFLDRFVLFEHTANLLRFALRFPIAGKFKMDIFGMDLRDSEIFDLACTYLITCQNPMKNCLPLPDVPPIGWGPGANAAEAGLKPKTHDGAIIVSKDGNVEIRLAAEKNIQLHNMLKHALIDDATLSNYAVTRLENGEAIVNIRLPQGGEYALKLYADDIDSTGVAPNVLNYLIRTEGKDIHNNPFPNLAMGNLGKNPNADKLGIKALSHKGSEIAAKNGKVTVEFQADKDVELVSELHSSDPEAMKKMSVKKTEKNGKWIFELDMPEKGEYSLNVFAKEKGNTGRIYNVHTYLVKSDGRPITDGETFDEGNNYNTNVPIETVQTADHEVLIPLPPGFNNVAVELHRRNANDPPDPNQVQVVDQEGMKCILAKLPEYGEYMMNLYDRDENGQVRNIAKYQINRKPSSELYDDDTKMLMTNIGAETVHEEEEEEEITLQPDDNDSEETKALRLHEEQMRATRRQIHKAIEMKDPEMLQRYIAAYEKLNPDPDDELLQKARNMLGVLEAKEALTVASGKRDLDELKRAIAAAKAVNQDHQLDLQIALAQRLKEQLEKIEKLRHAVLNLDSKTIAELKTYQNPPDGVHQTMMATFILLGNSSKELKQWKFCQALMGKTGRESMMRRISKFDPKDCSVDVAHKSKSMIENFSMGQIRDVSAGAATFYGWSLGMIEEVESTGGSGKPPASHKAPSGKKSKKK